MKRREEIENAAKQKYPYEEGTKGMICEASIPIFIQGAEWADKTMIDKACEWLSKTLYIHTEAIEDKHWNETKTYDWVTSDYDSVSDFIDGFRKAMEE